MNLVPNLLALPDAALLADPVVLAATWFGTGLVDPLRAGLSVATVWLIVACLGLSRPALLAMAAVAASVFGIWSANAWEVQFEMSDDRRIVIDEVAGYLACLAVAGRVGRLGAGGIAALFLALDRLKPWPVSTLEAIPGGLGVVADDVILGLALGLAVRVGVALLQRGVRG
ncbi:MAG: phosphatidylglycerophosphatase A [Pseudorhizobium sp.]